MNNQFDSFKLQRTNQFVCNWSKTNALAKKHQLVQIQNQYHLINFISNHHTKIKPIGTCLSYQSISSVPQNGYLISLSKFNGIISVSQHQIQVYGGTPLSDIFNFLISINKILDASPGVIAIQTAAGAISTGTHGQGLFQSTLADAVVKMTIVTPKGKLIQIDRSNRNFGAYMTSLGCLGVILKITFRTIPNKIYHCIKYTTTYDDFIKNYINMNHQKQQVKAWWFPWTNQVQIWYLQEATQDQKFKYQNNGRQLLNMANTDSKLFNTIEIITNKLALQTKDQQKKGKHIQTLTRFQIVSDVVGNIYQIMNKGIPAPQINCQISIDSKYFLDVVEDLKQWHSHNKQALHYPFIFRMTGPSQAWLSNTYNQNSVQIGFLVYLAQDGSFKKGSLELLKQIELILLKYKGKPHLGKHFSKSIYNWEQIFPKWKDFKNLMIEQDKDGKFRNNFIEQLFKLSDVKCEQI